MRQERTLEQRTITGTRSRKPAPQVAQSLDNSVVGAAANPVWIQQAPWQAMPWFARRFQFPKPPFQTAVAAGATVNIVDFEIGNGEVGIIESVDITLESPVGLAVVDFNILRNGIPIPEVGADFTVEHPFDTVVARDIRIYQGDRVTITATNTGVLPFTTFVKMVGFRFYMDDVGDISWFYQGG